MKKILLTCLICYLMINPSFATDKLYNKYQYLTTHLTQEVEVKDFIEQNNYLSDRLRKKWLTYLAKHQQWLKYLAYYQNTTNIKRRCYYLQALYQTGNQDAALSKVNKLWLSGSSRPKACNFIFRKWQTSQYFSSELLWQRLELAIQRKNYGLAKALAKLLNNKQEKNLLKQWLLIDKNPSMLSQLSLQQHPYKNHLIVSGIKQWIKKDMAKAINYWDKIQKKETFSHQQKHNVNQQIALYLAIRNKNNAEKYFSKLDPKLTKNKYHEWRLRSALQQKRWRDLNRIIDSLPIELQKKDCWQYWLARSFEKLGETQQAIAIYALLSEKRNYYGFLASFRGKFEVAMEQKNYDHDPELLSKHQNQIDYINQLYKNNKMSKASLLSYELANDLSKRGQYHLARQYSDWQWHDKALMLANLSQYKHDLNLRFPLAYQPIIEKFSRKYQVEQPLIYAIIRQESTFRKKVKSSAGALGLMQVIPSTAKKVAKKQKIKLTSVNEMYQAKKNIQIGTAYLSQLAKRFKKHPILIAAAYNAGPRQVNYWLKKFPVNDTDIWIETLPWHETRNYLKNILAFYVVYQYRLNTPPSITSFMRKIQ